MTTSSERIILGIDPGTTVMGYGLIVVRGKQVEMLRMGVLRLGKLENQALKLKRIFERVSEIVNEYHPDELAIEAPFFGKNVQSMLKLGRAQGVAMAAALHHEIPIYEYSPRKIKQSITGNGSASKEQVALMLQRLLSLEELPDFLDATDALAAAVCHHLNEGRGVNGANDHKKKKNNGWASFVADNPNRVSK